MPSLTDVHAFIDWDSTRRCSWLDPIERARITSSGTGSQLSALYEKLALWSNATLAGRKRIIVRFYHGWHKGNQPSSDRLAISSATIQKRTFGSTLLNPPEPADRLLCGADLRDTIRERTSGVSEQKMVDTALIADLLWLARSKATTRELNSFLVVSEDDDMLPGLAVISNWGFKCTIMRNRDINKSLPGTHLAIHRL